MAPDSRDASPGGDIPPKTIRPSAPARHQLDRITASTRVRSRNTLALPGVDVIAEIALINKGHGRKVGDSRYLINGRVYVVKPNGAAYPESGDDVVSVSPFAMALLRDMIANRDAPALLAELIARNRRYTDEVIEEAATLFAIWKGDG